MSNTAPVMKDLLEAFDPHLELESATFPVTVRVDSQVLLLVALRLRDVHGFHYLANLTAVDYCDRFELVYHVYSVPENRGVVLKVPVSRENPVVPSMVAAWPAADWQEREVYDMFGIFFEGHPDLRRILLPHDFEGHPLRKDFAKRGD